jgi:hypothetical protein
VNGIGGTIHGEKSETCLDEASRPGQHHTFALALVLFPRFSLENHVYRHGRMGA